MQTFTRLGLQEKLRAHFVEKFGGEIAEAGGKRPSFISRWIRFRTDRSFQVTRSKLSKMLLDHAGEAGAEICEETAVEDVSFDSEGATIFLPTSKNIRAKYLIDASGRNSVIGNKFKLKKSYQHLQKLSLFAHYEGVEREAGIDGTLTRMVRTLDSWFWVIPLENDQTSIGVVLEAADFKKSGLSAERFFERAITEQPLIRNRIGDGRRISQVYTAADFSYRNQKLTGDRWLLAGDAAGFMTRSLVAAISCRPRRRASGRCFARSAGSPKADASLFRHYERLVNRAMDVYLRFVESWYQEGIHRSFSDTNATLPDSAGGKCRAWW